MKVIDNNLFLTKNYGISNQLSDIADWKLVVPKSLTKTLITRAHNPPTSGHLGIFKTR